MKVPVFRLALMKLACTTLTGTHNKCTIKLRGTQQPDEITIDFPFTMEYCWHTTLSNSIHFLHNGTHWADSVIDQ